MVILAVARFPSAVAVIVAVPTSTPTTNPELETAALDGSDVVQEKARCNTSPEAFFASAESCSVPAGTRVAVSCETVTKPVLGAGGGATTPSPPQDPISQVPAMIPMWRCSLFIGAVSFLAR